MARETATQTDASAARAINEDWGSDFDSRQVNRWSRAMGQLPLAEQKRQVREFESGLHPSSPPNAPELLVLELDGGRFQGKEKDPQTGGRWREDKVCTVIKYAPGDGLEKEPEPLVSSVVATTGDVWEFGPLAAWRRRSEGYGRRRRCW